MSFKLWLLSIIVSVIAPHIFPAFKQKNKTTQKSKQKPVENDPFYNSGGNNE